MLKNCNMRKQTTHLQLTMSFVGFITRLLKTLKRLFYQNNQCNTANIIDGSFQRGRIRSCGNNLHEQLES